MAAIAWLGAFSTTLAKGDSLDSRGHEFRRFKKIQLTNEFWSEGVAVADVNRDGHMDILSGPFWYEGPDFKRRHAIFPATEHFTVEQADGTQKRVEGYEGALGKNNAYSNIQIAAASDFNGDGWPDVLVISNPGAEASWYENPGATQLARGQSWARHVVFDSVTNESPTLVDLLANGRPVILCMSDDFLGFVRPDGNTPNGKWNFHAVSSPLPVLRELHQRRSQVMDGKPWPYSHGLGYGDINADGRLDVLEPAGWWEQPASVRNDPVWKFHKWSFLKTYSSDVAVKALPNKPDAKEVEEALKHERWPFALGGAQIHAYDVNGDGLLDIVSSLDAHGYGLAWFEQLAARDRSGEIQFKPHFIMGATPAKNPSGVEFTQLHAVELVDIDGDGLKDIVTGKRFWAHGPDADPQSNAPAVLYWFKLERQPGGRVEFVPHLIDADSGVGTQIVTTDVNGDGRPDVIVANKKGTFVFFQLSAL